MARATNRLGQFGARYAGNWLFAGRVNLCEKEMIRLAKCVRKFLEQISSPRVPVWLEQHEQPSIRPALFRCCQGRLDFRRMMAVIVDDHDVVCFPPQMKPPLDA